MLLADFNDPTEAERWQSIDDVVMGGRSASAMLAGDQVGVFTGRLSLVSSLGLLISDQQAGTFRLELSTITAAAHSRSRNAAF